MTRKNSLKSKIILYFIIFTTIPLLLSSSWILYEMYKSKEESVFKKHLQLLKIVEEESDNIVKDIESFGMYVKNKYPIRKHNLIKDLLQIQKNISTILILNEDGVLMDFSSNIKNNHLFKGFDYSNTKYFRNIKNTYKPFWSDVYLSNASLKPEISYSLKINKNLYAILIVDLSVLNDFAKKFKSDDGSTMVRIVDRNGIFLAHPENPQLISQRVSIRNSELYKTKILRDYKHKQIKFGSITTVDNIGVYGITQKLNWYIIVREQYSFLFKSFNILIFSIAFFVFLLLLLSIYSSVKLFKSILKPLDVLIVNMNNIAHEKSSKHIYQTHYIELDNLLKNFTFMKEKIKIREKKILAEVQKNREKDIQLFEQSKMVSMGEMIGNIAHQWRQPLSIISTASTGMQLQKKYNTLSDDELNTACEMINKQTQYLSKTIDDFRNFIKGDRILIRYDLKECMESFIELVSPTATTNNLNLILSFKDDIELYGYPNELKQCLINIFNNAKDVLVNLKEKDRLLFISTVRDENNINIDIRDSGGGIDEDIFLKIFDPYFTTKHKSKGTGLGLHMAYNIIVDGMDGSLVAENVKFTYKKREYCGVNFKITLPLGYKL